MKKPKTTFGSWFRRATAYWRTGSGLAIMVLALVGLRWLWIQVQRPAHLEEIAAAYGSIRDFYGPAQMNHDGSKFIYAATANDRGRALFLGDTLTGQRKEIIEDKHGVGIWNDDFNIQAGPWAPDDSAFVCIIDNELLVSAPETNQIVARLDAGTNAVAANLVWLSPTEIAWAGGGAICFAQKGPSGTWSSHKFPYKGQVLGLTAIDSHAIAWLQDKYICRLDLSQDFNETNSPSNPLNFESATSPVTKGLVLWLDASTLHLPDGAPVTALKDSSPNGNDAVSHESPPKFNAPGSGSALNGRGTITFTSSNNLTPTTGLMTTRNLGITGNEPRSMFAVLRRQVGRAMLVGAGNPGVAGAYFGLADQFDGFRLPATMDADGQVPVTPRNWNVLSVVSDGTTQNGFLNGDLRSTTSAQLDTANAPVELGTRTVQSGEAWRAAASDGDFAELLVYDRALTEPERRRVEGYLGAKYFNRQHLSPQSPLVWFDTGLPALTTLAYSRETGQFLLSSTATGVNSIWRLDTRAGPDAKPVPVVQGQSSVRDPQWAGRDHFVYASTLDTRVSLELADITGAEKKPLVQLWGSGSFDWFRMTPDQKQLFLFGNLDNEPAPGIRRYDLAAGAWHPVISVWDYPTSHAVTVVHETVGTPAGNVTRTIYRPANFNPHKKYPLVIGDTMITDPIYGEPFMTGMAACGATVAVVERPWWTVGIERWAENVQGLYEQLKHDPTVDRRRVYLFAASAETYYLGQMVATNPAPWRGLILLNPSGLPDFSQSPRFQPRPKILLDAGGEEHDDDRFKQYQLQAVNWGVLVEYHTHPGETHRMVGSGAKLERARELKHFIFEE
jgi:hypothetical protein